MSKLKAKNFPSDAPQSCTLRKAPSNLEGDIKLAFEEKWGEEFRTLVSQEYSPKRFISYFDKCVKKKDVTAACLLKEEKYALESKGFSAPEITHYRGTLDHSILKELGFDSKKALASCIGAKAVNLKKYLTEEKKGAICYWEVTDVLEKNGIKYNKYDVAFSFKNAVFNKENLAAMEYIKNEFLDKGKESVSASCDGDLVSCIEKKLESAFGFDQASAKSLAKAVEGAL